MDKYLTDLLKDEVGTIVAIQAGWGLQQRLRRIGLAEGQVIRKLSELAFGGPVVVRVSRAQVAIGRGVARRILVHLGSAPSR